MNISTKTVTTRTHIGAFSADEIKAVALSYATKQAGVTDPASIMSSKVDVAGDGSVTVEIVEAVAETAAPPAKTPPADAPAASAPGAPTPGFATGFSAAPSA